MRLLCEGPIQKSLNDSCVKLRKAEDGPPFEFRLVRLPKGGGVEYEGKHNLFTFLMDIFHLGNAAADIRFFLPPPRCRRRGEEEFSAFSPGSVFFEQSRPPFLTRHDSHCNV